MTSPSFTTYVPAVPVPVETKVKTYHSASSYAKDARNMSHHRWRVVAVITNAGHVNWFLTFIKWVTVIGILMGPSRSRDTITVTYER